MKKKKKKKKKQEDHLTKSKHARKTRTWVLTRVVVTAVRPTPVQFPRDPE
jgi:hypothetical protein